VLVRLALLEEDAVVYREWITKISQIIRPVVDIDTDANAETGAVTVSQAIWVQGVTCAVQYLPGGSAFFV